MEEGLHRPGASGQELDVVHEQDVHRAKALTELSKLPPRVAATNSPVKVSTVV
jgi:hypothetical protein